MLVDLNAVELWPIAGDPGGVARVSVLALLDWKVDEDRIMQHERVGGWYWQPQCINHCHLLNYRLIHEYRIVYDAGVRLNFYMRVLRLFVLVGDGSDAIHKVEEE